MRKLGISPAQCAVEIRIHNLIERMDLDENSIETFFSTVYAKCRDPGIDPNLVAKYIEGLASRRQEQRAARSDVYAAHR